MHACVGCGIPRSRVPEAIVFDDESLAEMEAALLAIEDITAEKMGTLREHEGPLPGEGDDRDELPYPDPTVGFGKTHDREDSHWSNSRHEFTMDWSRAE